MLNYIKKGATALGFTAAFGGGILAGIEAAIMWSSAKVETGISFGVSSCFVNSVSYYFVVMRAQSQSSHDNIDDPNIRFINSNKSHAFAIAAFAFGTIMFVSNFVGMYVSYTVLGEKLEQLGDDNVNLPAWLLESAGILFGVASAVSGGIFNFKVGKQLWDEIRKVSLDSEEIQPVNSCSSRFFSCCSRKKERVSPEPSLTINTSLLS